jgi:hypothetical protein
VGAGSEWIEANSGNCVGSCEAHHVGISPQEDCSGAAGTLGEGEGGEEEIDGIKRGARSEWRKKLVVIRLWLMRRLYREITP